MHLYDVPLAFSLVGLALYVVLAGADFGAGIWQLVAGGGPGGKQIRDHAHHSMAPVWEANHVWLIFVLTVTWTAYPSAFGSIASTLSIPLFVAALGIIVRGAAYALRAGTSTARELRVIDTVSASASILTPFALGSMAGAIASRRVPVGNAAGHLFSSWLNPTSLLVGTLAVAASAYLAAVYLAADATRLREGELERQFRARALAAGLVAGAVAIGGLLVVHADAHRLYHGLVRGGALGGVIVSLLAGATTLALVWARRFEAARYTAALAVAAVIAAWALAQNPTLLPGLTIQQAAASHDTLVALIVAVLAGGVILFPSLALLFRLVLAGRLDHAPTAAPLLPRDGVVAASASGLLGRVAGACLIAGFGLLTVADAPWAHAIGVTALFAFIATGFLAAVGEP
ncbi:MAG: cytochrome d ubiquinol oxidase subunit II [Solirubrobacteraceae bacterium]|nr:MAG: cytochrome D ubiquinol oxidase subunit II [Solirubrobacterales bacterium]